MSSTAITRWVSSSTSAERNSRASAIGSPHRVSSERSAGGGDFEAVVIRTARACDESLAPWQSWQGVMLISFSSIRRRMLLLAFRQRLASSAQSPSNFVFAPRSARPRVQESWISSSPVPLSQSFLWAADRFFQGVSRSVPGARFFFASAWAATPVRSRRSHRGMSRNVPSTPIAPLRSVLLGSVTSFAGSIP